MMLLSVPKNHEEEQARASSTFKWAFADEEDEEEEGNEVHEEVVMEGICYCLLVRRKKLRRHAILPLRHYFLPLSPLLLPLIWIQVHHRVVSKIIRKHLKLIREIT